MPGLDSFTAVLGRSQTAQRTATAYKRKQRAYEQELDAEAGTPKRRRRRKRATGGVRATGKLTATQARQYRKTRGLDIGDVAVSAGLKAVGSRRVQQAAKRALPALTKAPLGAGAIGLAIAAGLAAYGLTTYAIAKLKQRKEGRAELAHQLAMAYRAARVKAEERKEAPLTAPELQQLATQFKNELAKLGLKTSDLGGL